MIYQGISQDPIRRTMVTPAFVVATDVFDRQEASKIIALCDRAGLDPGGTDLVKGSNNIRQCGVKFHVPNSDNEWIFRRLNNVIININAQHYGFELNGYDSFQYTVYGERDYYGWHLDTMFGKANPSEETRKLSLSLLLNNEFSGGELQIGVGGERDPITVPLMVGQVLAFPSFMLHRVTPITKGVRKSIVVWVTGPKFK